MLQPSGICVIMKYSILLPYYDRIHQLKETFDSFVKFYSGKQGYEVIIIEDAKQTSEMSKQLDNLIVQYRSQIGIHLITCKVLNAYNPASAFNEGAKKARGDYLILSSPECKHQHDILSALDIEFQNNKDVYVVCSCVSLNPDSSFHMWYQHSQFRDVQYHFCSAISKSNFFLIGGFNEEYTTGYGYEDNSFRDKVKQLGLKFSVRDDLLVSHLWHKKVRPSNYCELLKRNKELYQSEFGGA